MRCVYTLSKDGGGGYPQVERLPLYARIAHLGLRAYRELLTMGASCASETQSP